ncbi:Rpn family recombination-promoting nuclease/putative transposase, partial [Desulfobulbus sp. N3]|nr:Rpn family recombination-promoting nuclease/putative transposase [Desulfobulbus sp. N3]
MATKERYINLFTDYGFKKIFGEEPNKNLLLDFLNELLREEQGEIKNLTYLKTEQLGDTHIDRKAIFDLYCKNERGEKFIVELQKSKQNFFKDRALYYSTFPIREQAERGDWNFKLKAVYTVAILDFVFDEDNPTLRHRGNKTLKISALMVLMIRSWHHRFFLFSSFFLLSRRIVRHFKGIIDYLLSWFWCCT